MNWEKRNLENLVYFCREELKSRDLNGLSTSVRKKLKDYGITRLKGSPRKVVLTPLGERLLKEGSP